MLLQNSNAISVDDSYVIERSLRIPTGSYLLRTPSQQGNLRNWTLSFWIKRASLGDQMIFSALYMQVNVLQVQTQLGFGANGELYCIQYNSNIGFQANVVTSALLRDPSSWYHVTYVWDTPNAVASDRVRIYLNNERITSFSATTYPAQNLDGWINNISTTPKHGIGVLFDNGPAQSGSNLMNGYLAEFNFIDGQSIDSSNFGKIDTLTNQWVAKKYTGAYGTNGFYLDFKDGTSTSSISQDKSGNNNNWTPFNFIRSSGVDDCWMKDVPAGNGSASSGNYAVLNPLSGVSLGLTLANLRSAPSANSAYAIATMAIPLTGKWYAEMTVGSSANHIVGLSRIRPNNIDNLGQGAGQIGYYWNGQGLKENVSQSGTWATTTTNDVIGICVDADASTVTFYKNNVVTGSAISYSGLGEMFIAVGTYWVGGVLNANFGQRSFAYTPPTGFKALCTANLPTPTIAKPNKYFDVLTYTGDGTTNRSFSSMQFSPDLVWIKHRSGTISHGLWNSNVGGGVNKGLATDRTVNEASAGFDDTNGYLTTFDSNGFSVKTGVYTNNNATPYVAWQWRASDLPAVINNVGSIVSTVSANPSAGFSIVTYTGTGANATVGHGLGIAPKVIISKSRNNAGVETGNWFVWHASAGTDFWLRLNTTDAKSSISGAGGGTVVEPSSSVFTTAFISGSSIASNNYVAYCFADVEGYSKFGSYIGNGSADGTFVYTGFRPRFIMIKSSSAATDWEVFDTSRDSFNQMANRLYPNSSSAEAGGSAVDALSNGFKLRLAGTTNINSSGATYIYMAFAETPFQYSNGR